MKNDLQIEDLIKNLLGRKNTYESLFNKNVKRTYGHNKVYLQDKYNIDDILTSENMELVKPKMELFYVYGCPKSTDIDVAIIFNNKFFKNDEMCKFYFTFYSNNSNAFSLQNELKSLGYDTQREIDYNYLTMDDDKNIVNWSIGSLKIHNIILSTYQYHRQMYSLVLNSTIQKEDKMIIADAIATLLLNKFTKRTIKNRIESSSKINLQIEIKLEMEKLQINNNKQLKIKYAFQKWRYFIGEKYDPNYFKSLVTKLLQLIMLINDGYIVYTKDELYDKTCKYIKSYHELKCLLFRTDTFDVVNCKILDELFTNLELCFSNKVNTQSLKTSQFENIFQ